MRVVVEILEDNHRKVVRLCGRCGLVVRRRGRERKVHGSNSDRAMV